ncbi:MAG TPA: glycosyltransferase [Tardiphaga sp.]
MNKPLVSVVIPTYNRAGIVVRAIESACAQVYENIEIIVVDDGSTDNTTSVLAPYGDKIRYLYQENGGVSSARNAGMAVAKGTWLAFLDSDDEWHPSYLKRQIENVSDSQMAMQMTNCRFIREDGSYDSYFSMNGIMDTGVGKVEYPFTFVLDHWGFQIGSIIFLLRAVEAAAVRFNERLRLSEDLDFIARVSLQGSLGIVNEELVYQFRRSETTDHLSKALSADPLKAVETEIGVYEGFRTLNLNPSEVRSLNRKLSGKIRARGNLLRGMGKMKEARRCYFHAMKIDLSLRSFGKYAGSLLRV